MYNMFSTPLIDSSSGAATVSASTLGLAPGNWARTTTDGGTTSGYSEMGSCSIASPPASKMRTDSTPANMGRSIKNLEIFMMGPDQDAAFLPFTGEAPSAAPASTTRSSPCTSTGLGVQTSTNRKGRV